jgi:transcriptional regulator with XRE-family HTH domain
MQQSDGKHFGQRLRESRVAAGLSQSELEDISGIPKARLSRYENGHVEPSIQTLARLSRALNVSEASLLGDQRAILEDFFQILWDRGVRISSGEQGAKVANAIADLLEALAVKMDAEAPEDAAFTEVPDGEVQTLATQVLG